MYSIVVYHKNETAADERLMTYDSEILPMVGDMIAGIEFPDKHQRIVMDRLLLTNNPTTIIINVVYAFPSLVELQNKQNEKTEAIIEEMQDTE